MNTWLNVSALWKVVVFGLILGAGLPALFAVGVRAGAGSVVTAGGGTAGVDTTKPNTVGTVIATICYAIVAIAVILGVLFVARDFIGHHTGWYILGAKAK